MAGMFGHSATVERPLRELASILTALEQGSMDCPTAHARLERLGDAVGVTTWHSGGKPAYLGDEAKKAAAIWSLVCEVQLMTMFNNPDRQTFSLPRRILDTQLLDYSNNTFWRQLMKKKGPISNLQMLTCNRCDRTWPQAGIGEFQWEGPLFCGRCGSMAMVPLTLKEFKKGDLRQVPAIAPLPVCRCGGRLENVAEKPCPECRSSDITKTPVSPYEYFQTHRWYRLKAER